MIEDEPNSLAVLVIARDHGHVAVAVAVHVNDLVYVNAHDLLANDTPLLGARPHFSTITVAMSCISLPYARVTTLRSSRSLAVPQPRTTVA